MNAYRNLYEMSQIGSHFLLAISFKICRKFCKIRNCPCEVEEVGVIFSVGFGLMAFFPLPCRHGPSTGIDNYAS